MKRCLKEFVIDGVHTTLDLHFRILNNETFEKGEINTHFLDQNPQLLKNG